jgi:uncharacterized cupredoxin-like copper-binding protein
MKRFSTLLAAGAIAAAVLTNHAVAETATTVNVALMDLSAVASGPVGQGFGMMGFGSGFGMMSPGMMGRGGGQGMMGMMSIRADTTSAKVGPVTFNVTNWSRSVVHEMLVVAVDSADAPLPYDFAKQIIPEDQVKVLGETNELQPNASKSIMLTLAPGTYLLVCNVPGHFATGMVLPFTVGP